MPRLKSAIAFGLSSVLWFTETAATQPAAEVVVTAPRANVRLKPSASSAIVETVPVGAVLLVLEDEGPWLRVSLPATSSGLPRVGYISASIVEKQPHKEKAEDKRQAASVEPPEREREALVKDGADESSEPVHQASPAPDSAAATDLDLQRSQDIVQKSIHGGHAVNPAYWRQVAKVVTVLERRQKQGFNLISPIIDAELKMVDKAIPARSKNPAGDIELYREISVKAVAVIEGGESKVDWFSTLSGVEPERNAISKLKTIGRQAATVSVYGINPVMGIAVTGATKAVGR